MCCVTTCPTWAFIAAAYLGSTVVDHATSYIRPLTGESSLKRPFKLLPFPSSLGAETVKLGSAAGSTTVMWDK